MWRENFGGVSYLYVPLTRQVDSFCNNCYINNFYVTTSRTCAQVVAEGAAYCDFGRHWLPGNDFFSYYFSQGGTPQVMRQYVRLNTFAGAMYVGLVTSGGWANAPPPPPHAGPPPHTHAHTHTRVRTHTHTHALTHARARRTRSGMQLARRSIGSDPEAARVLFWVHALVRLHHLDHPISKWNYLHTHARSPVPNGVYALWKDGVLVNYADNVVFRQSASTIPGIGGLFFSTFMGGGESDPTWAPIQTQGSEFEYARLFSVGVCLPLILL